MADKSCVKCLQKEYRALCKIIYKLSCTTTMCPSRFSVMLLVLANLIIANCCLDNPSLDTDYLPDYEVVENSFAKIKQLLNLSHVQDNEISNRDYGGSVCFKTLLTTYKRHCGSLFMFDIGIQPIYLRNILNMCVAGITTDQLDVASIKVCSKMSPSSHVHLAFTDVRQCDCPECNLQYLRNWVKRSQPGSQEYVEAKKQLDEEVAQFKHEDDCIAGIGKLLFKNQTPPKVKNSSVEFDDQYTGNYCPSSLMDIFWKNCGPLFEYGLRHAETIYKICDAGVTEDEFIVASSHVCST